MGEKASQETFGDYITTARAAKILNLSQRRVSQLCDSGELKAVKIARRWLCLSTSVYKYARSK